MLTLYGTSRSRAARSILALEELGLEYEHVPLRPMPGTVDRVVLKGINPNGHIPVLDDDGLIVWESMAINLYLADKYPGALWLRTAEQRAEVYQWSFWVQTEMDRKDWEAARRSGDEAPIRAVTEAKIGTLGVLDARLSERLYLLGDTFSLADLNVAGSLSQPNEAGRIDWQRLDPFEIGLPSLGAWLKRCTTRDSWKRVADYP